MKMEVSIDPSFKEPKIIVFTDKLTDEIAAIMKRLSKTYMDSIAVFSDKGVELIDCSEIIRMYSEKQKVFLQTAAGRYLVRFRLYELEEKLAHQHFVRISNSEIVNTKMITSMDISMTGTIGVFLKGNIKTYASRRYVSKIKKRFGI